MPSSSPSTPSTTISQSKRKFTSHMSPLTHFFSLIHTRQLTHTHTFSLPLTHTTFSLTHTSPYTHTSTHTQVKRPSKVRELLAEMQSYSIPPGVITYNILLSACAAVEDRAEVRACLSGVVVPSRALEER